ncbi:hypothetical protein [Ferrimicrobium acidiphilum]|uniref:hypothetical protein n=1 Tax=Ferrimicrobium acidiphilum TaxID=121039 RepID=UPI0023F3C75A|nr:hypothetical protein [Ferrimicrobium acidiphilum]
MRYEDRGADGFSAFGARLAGAVRVEMPSALSAASSKMDVAKDGYSWRVRHSPQAVGRVSTPAG